VALGDSDTAALLADLKTLGEAVDVVLGGTTTQGVVRRNQDILGQDGHLIERVDLVTIKAGSLPGLAVTSTLTVGGVTRTVRDLPQGDDGGLTDVVLD